MSTCVFFLFIFNITLCFQCSTPYKLLRQVDYPFEINDENTIKQRIVFEKLSKFVTSMEASSDKKYVVDSNMEIPLNLIMPYVSDCCSSVEDLE